MNNNFQTNDHGDDEHSPDEIITTSLAWSPDGQYLAVGTVSHLDGDIDRYHDPKIYLVRAADQSVVKTIGFEDDEEFVLEEFFWSLNGRDLYVKTSYGLELYSDVFHNHTVEYLQPLERGPIADVALSADRSLLVTIDLSKFKLYLRAMPLGNPLQVIDKADFLQNNSLLLDWLGCSSDGRLLATADWDGYVRLWDAVTGQLVHALQIVPDAHSSDARFMRGAWRPSSRDLAVGERKGFISVSNVETGERLSRVAVPHGVFHLVWHPTFPLLSVSGFQTPWGLINPYTGQILTENPAPVMFSDWSPDGRFIALATQSTDLTTPPFIINDVSALY